MWVCYGVPVGYFLNPFFKWFMDLLKLPFAAGFKTALISGVIGAWTHILIDGIYHYDVRLFWPAEKHYYWKFFHNKSLYLSQPVVKKTCLVFWAVAIILYGIYLLNTLLKNK